MNKLKLSNIKGLLPEKPLGEDDSKLIDQFYVDQFYKKLSDKNLLDFVEARICPECKGKGQFKLDRGEHYDVLIEDCPDCDGNGAIIKLKEKA